MKCSALFYCLFFVFTYANGQSLAVKWQKCIGGSKSDSPSKIRKTLDGGYVIFGATESNDGDVNYNHGKFDVLVVKLDSNLNIQWSKTFGGSENDIANWGEHTKDSGYIFCGYTSSTDGDLTDITTFGKNDSWIVKLDKQGSIVWQKVNGGVSDDQYTSVIENFDGNYVALGTSSTYLQFAIEYSSSTGAELKYKYFYAQEGGTPQKQLPEF